MRIKQLLQIITAATIGGVALVFVLVLLMGHLIKEGTRQLTDHDMALIESVSELYAQGLQSGQAVRNVILNPADTIAVENGKKADIAFAEAFARAKALASGPLQPRLDRVAELWAQMLEARGEVLALAYAGKQREAHALLNREDTPRWREAKEIVLEELQAVRARLSDDSGDFFDRIDLGVWAISIIMAICLVVIVLAVHFVYRRITRPLDEAVAFAHTIARGDLSPADLIVRAEDEIGKVTVSLNEMKAALKTLFDHAAEKSHKLEELNRSLEEKVGERTAELEEKNRKLHETLEIIKNAQAQLIESEKMASLGSLVAGVAHEINTPVGIGVTAASHLQESAKTFGDQFRAGGIKKSDLESFLEVAEQSSSTILANLQRAADLIQSFKRVAVNQSSESQEVVCVRGYVGEILTSLTPQLKKTKLKMEVDCPEELCFHTLPGAFSQIVTNLVMNAIIHAYEPQQEGTLKLRFSKEDEKKIRFEFIDDGKGIPAEVLPKIFDPFFTTKRGQGGSGLGLNIIYNIVTQSLGGSIRCESTVGKGTTFIILMENMH
ncbi:MAG: ATP-binding protein [Campylobacterales bacterium]